MSDTFTVTDRAGKIFDAGSKEAADKAIASGDYLPIGKADVAAHDEAVKREERTGSVSGLAATAVEHVGSAAIDAVEAPFALPHRAAAALGSKYLEKHIPGLTDEAPVDALKGYTGPELLQKVAGPINSAFSGKSSAEESEAFRKGYSERSEDNPWTALGGNLGGSIIGGGALASGAKAIGGGAARALGGGLAARAAGAVTTGAVEGAAYGQAGASEDSYVQNAPLTAEKMIAAMGWGAVIGGGVSLAAHAASGALGMVRNGSRGATPPDSPRLSSSLDEATGAVDDVPSESGVRPVAEPAAAAPKYEVNVGAFDKETMRPESAEYIKAHPEDANRLNRPTITVYEGEGPAVSDGRHRMQAAIDRGESSNRCDCPPHGLGGERGVRVCAANRADRYRARCRKGQLGEDLDP